MLREWGAATGGSGEEMNAWDEQVWTSRVDSGVPRRDRRSGPFRSFVPARLMESPLALEHETEHLLARAERDVRSLPDHGTDLAAVARFLLRSEAIASSRIEGIAPSPKHVALAELGQREKVEGVSDPARLVANNMTVVREATTQLAQLAQVTIDGIVQLHRSLLVDQPELHGLRTRQNWIGGSTWHPLDADFVPPAPERVSELMADLVGYMNTASHAPLVQAALTHAQFETIHPFSDGNGRVGRALIHTVLARRGVSVGAVLPISLVFSTFSDRYVSALQRFRTDDTATSRNQWVRFFAEAAIDACAQAHVLAEDLTDLRAQWQEKLSLARRHRGASRALRKDSVTGQILADLMATPVLTVDTVQRIHGPSRPAAQRGLDELADAGILHQRAIGRGRRAYICEDALTAITWTERRLASTQFDTRQAAPHRGVPQQPETH